MTDSPLTPVHTRACERCGTKFEVSPKSPKQRFCSLGCSASRPRHRAAEAERFWPKVDMDGPIPAHKAELGPCWVWIRCLNEAGYGQFALAGGRLVLAYRWAWEQEHGPVPDGLVLDHLCRNPACVRPDHLEPVTQAVNAQRGLKGDLKPPTPLRPECVNGHLLTPENRYLRKDRHREQYGCRQCARDRQRRYAERRVAA